MSTPLVLTEVFLNLAADPSVYWKFDIVTGLSTSTSVPGEVRLLANGRERVVRRTGKSTTMPLAFETTQAELARLQEHCGETMCIRDDVGKKFFGVFFEVPAEEDTLVRDRVKVTLQIRKITYSEAV